MTTTTYGLTDTGFVIKTLTVIRADLAAALQAAFGNSIDLGDSSIFGQIVGILAERFALLWELAEMVNSSQDPNKATGFSLDAVSAITGTARPPAAHSASTLTLFGTPSTLVASGSTVATASTGAQFTTTADATIGTVANWAGTTSYNVGDRVFSDTSRIYQCVIAGTSASSPPVSGTGSSITDGGVTWAMIATGLAGGSGAIDVQAHAISTGAVTAVVGDLTVIVTPVFGWAQVTNLNLTETGRDLASDEELRALRLDELQGEGNSPADAIRAALLKIVNVLSVFVFTNNTDATVVQDGDSMPPHSVEALVLPTWSPGDPLDQQIYDTLRVNVAAGIVTTGNQSGTSLDSQGIEQTIKFSRPTAVPIYVAVTLTKDPTQYPADGDTQVADAIATWGAGVAIGRDAVASQISAQVFQVPGVLDVSLCYIGTAPSPSSSATVVVTSRQLATYTTGHITVASSNGTP